MIEIRSIGGRALYTSKDATDVRAAVEAAVRRGADLRGAYLRGADLRGAYLRGAYLRGAYLRGAYLRGAYLRGADLRGAYLGGAHLHGAYLRGAHLGGAYLGGAYLGGAYLHGADLRDARGILPQLTNDLLILLDQPGKIRAYKLVNEKGEGPYNGGIVYEKGGTYEVPDASTDPARDCGKGINVATLPWCLREWRPGYRVLIVEFARKDIACIPDASDGKFRLHRCKVVGEKKIDPVELGLVREEQAA